MPASRRHPPDDRCRLGASARERPLSLLRRRSFRRLCAEMTRPRHRVTDPLRGYAGSMAARTGDDIWGQRTPYSAGESWPVRVDQHLIDGVTVDDVDSWVPSACLL